MLHRSLDRIDSGLAFGTIEVSLPDGATRILGGRGAGPTAIVVLRRWRALIRLALGGSAGWYEAWADGDWHSPDPVALFDLFMRNRVPLGEVGRAGRMGGLIRRAGHWLRANSRRGARRNIAFHYDLGNDFYAAWLDLGMTYSSALFDREGMTLEAGQAAKLAAILDRTACKPGDALLEIGCGWGSLLEAAARAGIGAHGITLSAEQMAYAERRLVNAGLAERARVSLTDYRDVSGRYDAIASIEMVEAVGRAWWPAYLDAIAAALKPGGRAAIQYIAIDDAIFETYAANVDFIQSYIFPGGLLLSEREFRALAEARGLEWRDRAGFGLDYAETLREWRMRFDAADLAGQLPTRLDRRFRDLWRYYLMYCEGGFRGGGIDVAQVTLFKRG